jgi:RNA polymerase sigma-70 factor (ECF subfamily)
MGRPLEAEVELCDGELLAKAVSMPVCFVQVFDRHGRAVHAYLVRRAGLQVADDVFDEVWLQAFASRAHFDERCPDARPWLYGIARNVLRSHFRARARVAPGNAHATPDAFDEADTRVDAARHRPALRAALAALPDQDREVLLLVAWEGLTPAEAAASLGIPQGTARWRLHRARAAAQRTLHAVRQEQREHTTTEV